MWINEFTSVEIVGNKIVVYDFRSKNPDKRIMSIPLELYDSDYLSDIQRAIENILAKKH